MKKLIKTVTAFVMAFGILVSGLSVQSSVAAEAETTQTEAGGKEKGFTFQFLRGGYHLLLQRTYHSCQAKAYCSQGCRDRWRDQR